MPFGLTSEGFVSKTLAILKQEIEEDLRAAFGDSIRLEPQSAFGQFVGTQAERFALLWELAQALDSAIDPDKAAGEALDGVAALTGTIREAAAPSGVVATCTGTPSTALAVGRQASVVQTGVRFETVAAATIAVLPAWAGTTSYTAGQRVTNASRAYHCITTGVSAGSGGPTTTSLDITDGTAHWRYLGEGTGAIDVDMESVDDGPVIAVSGTLTVIETPVGGWSNVVNLLDAVPGQDEETDAALRQRRITELATGGKATHAAIVADLLAVEDVTSVLVFENETAVVDAEGLPPKSVEAVVLGGTDADIREALYNSVAAGIATHGAISGVVTAADGQLFTVRHSRPTTKNIYVRVDLVKDPDTYPTNGDDQVKAAIVADEAYYELGRDVTSSRVESNVWGVAGVLDVTLTAIGLAPAPTLETTIVLLARELAAFDSSRITINSIDGTP